jgi:hypothetical protein
LEPWRIGVNLPDAFATAKVTMLLPFSLAA